MKKIFIFIFLFLIAFNVKAEEVNFAENAKSAILMEVSTGKIIFSKNENEKLSPASMTKMMSLLLIMENIEKGVISLDEMVTVSENASGMGGSQILLETGEKMSVDDLIKGITIASGNDAVVALAEKIAGTEAGFVKMMNDKAKELKLTNTNFKNPHGLDEANHYSSAKDMAIIAKELVKHQKILEYSSIYETYLRENTDKAIWLVNTNKLVRFYDGVDGLKTGFTSSAGYCLTATAKRNNMRIIAVVMGEPDSKTRNKEVSEMFDYMFAQYEVETLLSKDSKVKTITNNRTKNINIDIVPKETITSLNRKVDGKKNITYNIKLDKIKDKIKINDKVGIMEILENNKVINTIELTVNKEVKKANIFEVFIRNLNALTTGL